MSGLLSLLVVLAACGGTSSNTGMNMGGSPLPSGTMGATTGGTMMTTVEAHRNRVYHFGSVRTQGTVR
jgi:hypothetical protein